MNYLELAPAITALRMRPTEFELRGNALHHLGCRHSFHFSSPDEVRIEAFCDCSQLRATPRQSRELHEVFQQWQSSYWRLLTINRQINRELRVVSLEAPRGPRQRDVVRVHAALERVLHEVVDVVLRVGGRAAREQRR